MRPGSTIVSGHDFRRLFRDGRRASRDGITVHAVTRSDPGFRSRLGLAVGSKCGGAVTRNRIKRRLREAFRAAAPASGWDVVISARPAAAGASYQELEKAVSEALRSMEGAR